MISTNRDTYMTIWSIEENNGKYRGRGSTSKKNKDGTYSNSNWNNIYFVADAAEKASKLQERDRIVVKPGDIIVENIYLPEKGDKKASTYLRVTIFNFDKLDSNTQAATTNNNDLPL